TDFVGTARPQAGTYDVGAYELQPTTIITPVAWGQGGGAYCPATGAFDEQPTWNATAGAPAGVSSAPHASTATGYANRYWYVDFGANYANVRITEMWTRYRPSSSGNQAGFGTMWWDADLDTVKEGPDATGFKFNSAQGLSSSGSQQWVRDADFNGTPKTPAARYLIVPTGSTVTDRANEFAFVGYTVP
ncbi:MAG TPA: hypothetical protein VNR00_02020, partial [Opitutus sp.]|nr:hypothetical protein [Opitutus sp.]